MVREIYFYKHYFYDFFDSLPEKVQNKFDWFLDALKTMQIIPGNYLRHISGTKGLYELRLDWGSDAYRVFCFFDSGNLIVLSNGFQKKSQKTPVNEIDFALRVMAEYFNEKMI